jgi:hypothetical protein
MAGQVSALLTTVILRLPDAGGESGGDGTIFHTPSDPSVAPLLQDDICFYHSIFYFSDLVRILFVSFFSFPGFLEIGEEKTD